MKLLREDMTEVEVKSKSNTIMNKVINSSEYASCNKIFTYLNINKEVETVSLILHALQNKKKVALPVVNKIHKQMVFIEINSLDNLLKSSFGVLEPEFSEERILKSDNDTIIIVPGLQFSEAKYRVGYGGGYYDKFISKNIYMKTIGVCYSFQLTKWVPYEEFDIRVDSIITENISIIN